MYKIIIYIFFSMMLVDILWAFYFISLEKRYKLLAASTSGAIIFLQATVVVNYVKNPILIYIATLGGIVGTLIALWIYENKDSLKNIYNGSPFKS